MRKFEKLAKARGKSLQDTIHQWYMTKGTSKFIEVLEQTKYWSSTSWIDEEELPKLEPLLPSEEEEGEGEAERGPEEEV